MQGAARAMQRGACGAAPRLRLWKNVSLSRWSSLRECAEKWLSSTWSSVLEKLWRRAGRGEGGLGRVEARMRRGWRARAGRRETRRRCLQPQHRLAPAHCVVSCRSISTWRCHTLPAEEGGGVRGDGVRLRGEDERCARRAPFWRSANGAAPGP